MIHTETLYDLQSRLVQGECKSKKFESSLISLFCCCLDWSHWWDRAANCVVNRNEDSLWANAKCYVQMLPIVLNSNSKREREKKKKTFKKRGQWNPCLAPFFLYFFLLTRRVTNPCYQVKHTHTCRYMFPAGFHLCLVLQFGEKSSHVCSCFHFWACHSMKSVSHWDRFFFFLNTLRLRG